MIKTEPVFQKSKNSLSIFAVIGNGVLLVNILVCKGKKRAVIQTEKIAAYESMSAIS